MLVNEVIHLRSITTALKRGAYQPSLVTKIGPKAVSNKRPFKIIIYTKFGDLSFAGLQDIGKKTILHFLIL